MATATPSAPAYAATDKPKQPLKPASGGMARAAGLTIVLVLLSRVTGVLRDIALAHTFGQRSDVSVFRAAFGVPDLIALVIAGGAVSSVFIPIFSQYWNDKREDEAWKVFGSIISLVAVIVAVLVGLMEVGAVPLTHLLNERFEADDLARAASLTRILLPVQWFLMVGSLLMGTLYARKRFLIPGVGPILYNVGQIVGCVGFGKAFGIEAVAWGALVGAFVGSFVLPIWEIRRSGVRWQFGFNLHHPGVVKMGQLMIPVILGQSLSQLNMWATTRFLPADGRIAALTNAYNLTQAPIGIFAQAFAIVLLPTISELAARKDWAAFREALSDGVRRVLFLTVPASVLMMALAPVLIRLIYVHGKFTEADVPVTAAALLCYSLSTFAWSAATILYRGFHALQDTRTPIFITTPILFLFIGIAWAYTKWDPAGSAGLALGTSFCGILSFVLFLVFLQKRIGGLNLRGIALGSVKITLASLAAGATAWYLDRVGERFLPHGTIGAALAVIGFGGIACAVYVGMCYVLRVPELRTIREMFRKPKVGIRPARGEERNHSFTQTPAEIPAEVSPPMATPLSPPVSPLASVHSEAAPADFARDDARRSAALRAFGERYIRFVRDRTIVQLDREFFTNTPDYRDVREKALEANEDALRDLTPYIVDTALAFMLAFLEANPDVKLLAPAGDDALDVAAATDSLEGELYGSEGWINRFSKERGGQG